jgi:dynein heavy chain
VLRLLQEKILKLLHECEGNLLDDEQLINTLNNSKRTAGTIKVCDIIDACMSG